MRAAASVMLIGLAVSGLASPQSPAPARPLPSARAVVERHIEAVGGRAAFTALRSIHARGRLELAGTGVGGDFELFAARPNRLLYRVSVSGVGLIEHAFDGKVGWTLNPASGPALLSGRELTEAADDAWFDRSLYDDSTVKEMRVVDRAEFDGRPALKVRLVLQSGSESVEYFDAERGWQIGSEAERASPQGIVPTVTMLRGQRRFGAVIQPTVLVQRALGIEQLLSITSYEYDQVTDAAFARPPAIAALVGAP